ncbi:hypothetical protein BJ170DRAFT_678671 [Xylariales sp. AK1849]|nr:hypothetical protein BJ170DRAFT_678671 [Xylariales sp. AK1849]
MDAKITSIESRLETLRRSMTSADNERRQVMLNLKKGIHQAIGDLASDVQVRIGGVTGAINGVGSFNSERSTDLQWRLDSLAWLTGTRFDGLEARLDNLQAGLAAQNQIYLRALSEGVQAGVRVIDDSPRPSADVAELAKDESDSLVRKLQEKSAADESWFSIMTTERDGYWERAGKAEDEVKDLRDRLSALSEESRVTLQSVEELQREE